MWTIRFYGKAVAWAPMLTDSLMLSGEWTFTWYDKIKLTKQFNNLTLGAPNIQPKTLVDKYEPRVNEFRMKLSWKFKGLV